MIKYNGERFTPKQAAKFAMRPIVFLGAGAWEDELEEFEFTEREKRLIDDQVTKLVDRIARIIE